VQVRNFSGTNITVAGLLIPPGAEPSLPVDTGDLVVSFQGTNSTVTAIEGSMVMIVTEDGFTVAPVKGPLGWFSMGVVTGAVVSVGLMGVRLVKSVVNAKPDDVV
jgi:hypothetical protein